MQFTHSCYVTLGVHKAPVPFDPLSPHVHPLSPLDVFCRWSLDDDEGARLN